MDQKQRNNRQNDHRTAPENENPNSESLDEIRNESDDIWTAADHAISKALSGNSRQFLKEARQQGGQ